MDRITDPNDEDYRPMTPEELEWYGGHGQPEMVDAYVGAIANNIRQSKDLLGGLVVETPEIYRTVEQRFDILEEMLVSILEFIGETRAVASQAKQGLKDARRNPLFKALIPSGLVSQPVKDKNNG